MDDRELYYPVQLLPDTFATIKEALASIGCVGEQVDLASEGDPGASSMAAVRATTPEGRQVAVLIKRRADETYECWFGSPDASVLDADEAIEMARLATLEHGGIWAVHAWTSKGGGQLRQ